jgi:hypothetical protein
MQAISPPQTVAPAGVGRRRGQARWGGRQGFGRGRRTRGRFGKGTGHPPAYPEQVRAWYLIGLHIAAIWWVFLSALLNL